MLGIPRSFLLQRRAEGFGCTLLVRIFLEVHHLGDLKNFGAIS
jgi:hypothetical protein